MKVEIQRQAVLRAFGDAAPFVGRGGLAGPAQRSVLLEAGEGCSVTGNNLDCGVRIPAAGVKVIEPGRVLLDTEKVGKILRLSPDPILLIEETDRQMRISGFSDEYVLELHDPDLFPVPEPARDDLPCVDVAPADLLNLIRQTAFAADLKASSYALAGCHATIGGFGSNLRFTAADGRRIARRDVIAVSPEDGPQIEGQVIIPVPALRHLERLAAGSDGPMRLIFGNRLIWAVCPEFEFYARLLEGRFPGVETVFGMPRSSRIVLAAGDLASAVERAKISSDADTAAVNLSVGPNLLTIAAAALGSKAKVQVPIAYDGPPETIGLDHDYLLDYLKCIPGDSEVTMSWESRKHPVGFESGDSTCIIMPLTERSA
jgi:DNA polymerase III sliding clamp (beta) subunit (PCNA family)